MKILRLFQFEEQNVRTLVIDDEPYFVGKDVAEILGYVKPRNAISVHVDDEDKKDALIQGTLGGVQTMTMINESGLYSLILSSKLPNAKKFKRWVTSEVLPIFIKNKVAKKLINDLEELRRTQKSWEKEKDMNNETHNLTLRLKKGLYESLKKISEEKGITVHELIVLAIVDKYHI